MNAYPLKDAMNTKNVCAAIILAALSAWSQGNIITITHITNPGHVQDSLGKPLQDVMVTYLDPAKRFRWDFSDASGNFGGMNTGIGAGESNAVSGKVFSGVSITGSVVRFSLGSPRIVRVDGYNATGRKLFSTLSGTLAKGSYAVNLGDQFRSKEACIVFFVNIQAGGESETVRCVGMGNGSATRSADQNEGARLSTSPVEKKAAAADTVRVGKTGYKAVYIPVSTLTESVGTTTLHKYNIESRIDSVINKLSMANKVVLMTQDNPNSGNPYQSGTGLWNAGVAPAGSDFNNWNNARMSQGMKIPGICGYDCVHGYIGGGSVEATMFPHNVAMGCIQDTQLIQLAGRVTAIESASRGVYWAFAPCIANTRDEHWGRMYESCGETPQVAAKVAFNEILGMQGRDLSLNTTILATAKHFAGDGGTQGGRNASNVVGPDSVLRQMFLPQYAAAVAAGANCIMASFSSWNGVGSHANKPLLTDWLKTQQGFDGFVVGDWTAHTFQGGSNEQACVNACISAGLDNPMAPGISATTESEITNGNNSGAISTDRINDACRRILRVLFRKGLFENYHALSGYDQYFHCPDHKQIARQCVAASMVVLKDSNSALPLKKTANVAVIGWWGNDIGLQCGGWTLGWQGAEGAQHPAGTSLYMSLQQQGSGNTVTYSQDGSNIPANADAIVVCIGIPPAAEYTKSDAMLTLGTYSFTDGGANVHSYNTITDLMAKASAVRTSNGKAKIVLALFVDGPVVATSSIQQADAVVCTWLGSQEGAGFGDVLYGDVHPTGKLNFAWPATLAQIPINVGNYPGIAAGDGSAPLYPIGYGLTY